MHGWFLLQVSRDWEVENLEWSCGNIECLELEEEGCFLIGKLKLHPSTAAYLGCHIKSFWRPSQFKGSLQGSLRFTSFIRPILKDVSSVFFVSSNHLQSFVHIPIHTKN